MGKLNMLVKLCSYPNTVYSRLVLLVLMGMGLLLSQCGQEIDTFDDDGTDPSGGSDGDSDGDGDSDSDSDGDSDGDTDGDLDGDSEPDTSVDTDPDTNPEDNDLFDVSVELSSAIGTVAIVEWSISESIDEARIQFGRNGEWEYSAPADLSERNYRTLLLGMKPNTEYNFIIIAQGGGNEYTSDVYSITTNPQMTGPLTFSAMVFTD